MAEPAKAPGSEALPDWTEDADEAIAACGDARSVVAALLERNDALERELAEIRMAVSFGYTRGRYRSPAE